MLKIPRKIKTQSEGEGPSGSALPPFIRLNTAPEFVAASPCAQQTGSAIASRILLFDEKLNRAAFRAAKAIGPIDYGDDNRCEPLDVLKHLTSDYLKKKLGG